MINDIQKRDDYIALKNNIQQAVKESRAVIILDESHVDKAGFYLKNFRGLSKRIETLRKELVDPLNQDVKIINSFFKTLQSEFSGEEQRLNNELQDFLTEQRQKQEELRIKEQTELEDSILSEAELFNDESVLNNIPKVEFKTTGLGDISSNVTQTRSKTWSLIDLDKVPRQYLILDEKMISQLRKDFDFEAESPIEGIKFTCSYTVKSK